MGTRLRHISGESLTALEEWIEGREFEVAIISITKPNKRWYIHYCLADFDRKMEKGAPIEVANPTQTLIAKKPTKKKTTKKRGKK